MLTPALETSALEITPERRHQVNGAALTTGEVLAIKHGAEQLGETVVFTDAPIVVQLQQHDGITNGVGASLAYSSRRNSSFLFGIAASGIPRENIVNQIRKPEQFNELLTAFQERGLLAQTIFVFHDTDIADFPVEMLQALLNLRDNPKHPQPGIAIDSRNPNGSASILGHEAFDGRKLEGIATFNSSAFDQNGMEVIQKLRTLYEDRVAAMAGY